MRTPPCGRRHSPRLSRVHPFDNLHRPPPAPYLWQRIQDNHQGDRFDLLDPASIDTFARNYLAGGRPLHLLIHSAGVMAKF